MEFIKQVNLSKATHCDNFRPKSQNMDNFENEEHQENRDVSINSQPSTKTEEPQLTIPVPDITEEDSKKEKQKIWKNILLISVAFFFLFTSFQGLTQLQSSLHIDQGMGTINQAILYAAFMVSSLLLPNLVIKKIGHKWCIAVCIVGYIIWMGANGIGRWWSMTPASVIVGLVGAPLWTAQSSYFTLYGKRYARLTGEVLDTVVTRFFGIFFFIFYLCMLVGSIISSSILNTRPENTTEPTEAALRQCGRNDCPWNNVTNINLEKPEPHVIWTMVGVYMGLACIAVITTAVFLDQLPKELRGQKTGHMASENIVQLLITTIKHLQNIPQILLIPITMYSGFKQTYIYAEWSKSFISCGLGIWMVGYVTVPFAIVNACISLTIGRVVKYTGRIPIFIFGALLDLGILITLYIWMPNPRTAVVFYVISALFGITEAIWKTNLYALYSSIFANDSEAAFSNFKMWESLGFILAFANSSALCTLVKTIVLTCVLCVGITGYLATEIYLSRSDS